MLSTARPTCFLIADISGYTGYLVDVELEHAQDILADLVGAVVNALRPDFRLAKLEGDAAFMAMTTPSSAAISASGGAGATSARRRPASATPARGSPISTSSSWSITASPSSTRWPGSRSWSART